VELLIRLLADGLVVPIVVLGAYALLFKVPAKSRAQSYGRVIMAGLTALLLAKLVGSFWQPDAARPFVEMGVAAKAAYLDNAGFPSDHVLFSAAITLAVWFETRQRKLAVLLAVLTGLVALGRVIALVHTPLDVLGGLAFASIGALWYFTKAEKAPRPKKKLSPK
jgi:membrane-associated phospholipid phosphatase